MGEQYTEQCTVATPSGEFHRKVFAGITDAMKNLADIRRGMLQKLVDDATLTSVANRLKKPIRQINDMLAGRKPFGDKVARQMEAEGNLPPYYFDGLTVEDQSFKAMESLPGYQVVSSERLNQIPVIGKGMGGLPDRIFTDEGRPTDGHDEFADVYSSDQSAFVIRVDGDSMYPKYRQGDYALVEPNTDPELEDDVLLKLNSGEVMLKRLLSRKGGILLGSYNESQTYRFEPDEIKWMYYVAHPVPARKIRTRF